MAGSALAGAAGIGAAASIANGIIGIGNQQESQSQSQSRSQTHDDAWGDSSSWGGSYDISNSYGYTNAWSKSWDDWETGSVGESNAFGEGESSGESASEGHTFGREATAKDIELAREQNALQRSLWQEQADYNAKQAEIDRQYQAEMSNTAYQRAVRDLLAAGLNPILAVGNMGASTPSGAMASAGLASSYRANVQAESENYGSSASRSYERSGSNSSSRSWGEGHAGSKSKTKSESTSSSQGGSSYGSKEHHESHGRSASDSSSSSSSKPVSQKTAKKVVDGAGKMISGVADMMGGGSAKQDHVKHGHAKGRHGVAGVK